MLYQRRAAATAQAVIVGDDPINLRVRSIVPRIEASPRPYAGRYPSANLVHNGVWYHGTYCVDKSVEARSAGVPDWDVLGPFVGFRISKDFGRTWVETDRTPAEPLFSENPIEAPVRIGAPHVVDFGRNMEHSPGGFIYLVAHGARSGQPNASWVGGGSEIVLLRVRPTPQAVNDPMEYEFFAGRHGSDRTRWSSDLGDAEPLLSWPGSLGRRTVTYVSHEARYIMCVTRPIARGRYGALFLEAAFVAGPYRWFDYAEPFGPEAYFLTIPSKFVDSRRPLMWLCY